jgi:hypothetical protein
LAVNAPSHRRRRQEDQRSSAQRLANSVSSAQFAGVGAVSKIVGSASTPPIKMSAAGKKQRPPGGRPFAGTPRKPGTLCRKHGRAPTERGVAEGAEAKRHHYPGRGLGN